MGVITDDEKAVVRQSIQEGMRRHGKNCGYGLSGLDDFPGSFAYTAVDTPRCFSLLTGMNRRRQTDSMTPSTKATANTSIVSAPEGRGSGSRAQDSPYSR